MRAVALLVAVLVLAGCFGKGNPPETLTATNVTDPTTPTMGPHNATLAAFNETNRTEAGLGGRAHTHDLWAGKERVTLVQGTFGLSTCCFVPKPAARGEIELPPGRQVWEGTGTIEATFTDPARRVCTGVTILDTPVCTDAAAPVPDASGGPAGLHLWLQHGMSSDYVDAGEIAWGKPLVFVVTDVRMVDMPHSPTTLWKFQVRSDDPAQGTLRFTTRIDAIRSAGEIPLWPGHPDFYADAHVRVVAQTKAKTSESPAGSGETTTAKPEKLISYGTKGLRAFVNITSFASPDPAEKPSSWTLGYHNASGTWNETFVDPANHSADKKDQMWLLPVDDNGMDSPYAPASRWEFSLHAASSIGTPDGSQRVLDCTGGCAAYTVEYEIVVLALDEAAWNAAAPPP